MIQRLISALTLLLISNAITAQAIQKGDFEISAGSGFGFYGLATNEFEDNTNFGLPGVISLGVSYQLSNSFGLGINYERNGFLTDPDSNNKAVSNSIGLAVAYNVVNAEKNAVSLTLEVGGSGFRYDDFKNEDYVVSTGGHLKLGGHYRHYFNDHLGFYLKLNLSSFTYTSFENQNGDQFKVYRLNDFGFITDERNFELRMIGMNFGFGLQYKF